MVDEMSERKRVFKEYSICVINLLPLPFIIRDVK